MLDKYVSFNFFCGYLNFFPVYFAKAQYLRGLKKTRCSIIIFKVATIYGSDAKK